MVTELPSAASQVAASQATTPPPTMASRSGMSTTPVASRLVHGFTGAKASGMAGELPVATTTACRAVSVRSPTLT